MNDNNEYYKADEVTVETGQPYDQVSVGEKKGFAIASLVLGIIGILLGCCAWYISLVATIVGLILGIIYLKTNKPLGQYQGKGLAIAGVICSSVGLLISVAMMIWFIFLMVNPDVMRDLLPAEMYDMYY